MGHCPSCGTELQSTLAAASKLEVTDRNVRARLRRRTMVGLRLGYTWLVPTLSDQPPATAPAGSAVSCPGCGERLFATQQAAVELGISTSRVHAILQRHPERLRAVRVGRRWLIPASGIALYQRRREQLEKLTADLDKDGTSPAEPTGTVATSGPEETPISAGEEPGPTREEEVTMSVKQGNCYCRAYPYPHRPGGGRCLHRDSPVPKSR